MPDDRNNDPVQSDFDDWLAEEEASPVDPTEQTRDPEDEESSTESEVSEDAAPDAGADVDTGEIFPVADEDPAPLIEDHPAVEFDAVDVGGAVDDATAELHVPDEPEDEPGAGPFHDDVTDEIHAPSDPDDEADISSGGFDVDEYADSGDETGPVDDAPVIEFGAFDGGHEPITGEMEIIVPEAPAFEPSDSEADELLTPFDLGDAPETVEDLDVEIPSDPPFDFGSAERAPFDPFEDTGEAVFVTGETPQIGDSQGTGGFDAGSVPTAAQSKSFAELWGVEDATVAAQSPEPASEDLSVPDAEEFGEAFTLAPEDFQRGGTRDHTGLAEAIAAAESEDTEQVALVAPIPGLESSVVGFEDVVQAEGHRRVMARASGDLLARVTTGLILVVALAASLVWRPALLVLATAVFVLGAGEFYTALVRHDRKPIALFGFIGIVAACIGAFAWSAAAIPIAFVIATVLLLLFYAITPGKADPMGNLALTATVMVWAGLGSFAMLIARSDDYRVLILGVVLTVAGADVAAFFVGRAIGRTHFAPWVSPKKTVEGLVAGVIVAFGIGATLHFFEPFELTSGLAVGAAAAVLTPIGDLAMSAAKRSLGLKDMGSVLPGHGGFLDRIDGLLFTIPAAWAIFVWAGLL